MTPVPIWVALGVGNRPSVTFLDATSGEDPQCWRGNDLEIHCAVFDESGAVVNLNNAAQVAANLYAAPDSSLSPLMPPVELDSTDIEPAIDIDDWKARTDQQFTLSIPAASTMQEMTSRHVGKFWLTIKILTEDGDAITTGGGWLRIYDDGTQSGTVPPVPPSEYYTKTQIDALFATTVQDPTQEVGDIIVRGLDGLERLEIGSEDQLLEVHLGKPAWVTKTVSGDVTGPSGATADHFASFSGPTGKIIKDSGVGASSFETPAGADAKVSAHNSSSIAHSDIRQLAADASDEAGVVASDLATHEADTNNPHSVTKNQVGLGFVDNTTDMQKPVSTAQALALAGKASLTDFNNHVGDHFNPHEVTKAQVGLGNADNTSDADKPISDATQDALDAVYISASNPANITQDSAHRFVSDTEKSTWNGKESGGAAAAAIVAHVGAADPHGDRADAASKYQPLSAGKGLSTNDYTTDEKTKLSGIAAGATANTASTANPLQAGTAAPGTAAPYAREDHVHPVDTSRAAATDMAAADAALWRAASARVGIDGIYFDGATSGRGLTMSAASALASLPTWGAVSFVLPTAAYSTAPTICAQSSTGAATVAYGQDITIASTTAGDLAFSAYGSSTSNFRKATLANFRATFSGLRVSLIWSFVAGSTAPSVWINGVAQPLTVTTGGTPPDFCASTLVTSVHKFLANWDASTATLIGYGLGAATQSDVDMHVAAGTLPFWMRSPASVTALTSGTLVRGQQYLISSYVTGDSFTNVGAESNATGVSFTATGTTPTTWSNASQLIALGALAIPLYQKSIYTADETGNGNYGTIVGGTAKVRFDLRTANLRDWTPYASAGTVLGVTDTAYTMLQKLDARIDEAAYQLQAGAAELAIPLSYTGTGAGVLTLRLFSDIAQTATIDGAGKFYTDAAGTLNEATSYAMTANAWTIFYIKVPSGTCTMRVPFGYAIRQFGSATQPLYSDAVNGPKINGLATGKMRMSMLGIYAPYGQGTTIISGTTYPWTNVTQVLLSGNSVTVSGAMYPWANATMVLFNGNSVTVSGTMYPWANAAQVYLSGNSMTVSGNLSTSALYSGSSNFELVINGSGMAVSYPTTRAWPRNISRIYVRPATGSMVSADVDRILIDIASTANLAAVGLKVIDLGGNCGAHTSASTAAIATLTGLGFAVTVN